MHLSYDGLWKMLSNLNVSKMEFAKSIGISNATLAKLGKDEQVALSILMRICEQYNCKIQNIIEFIPDTQEAFPDISTMDIGTILICSPFPLNMRNKYKLHEYRGNILRKHPCVVLQKHCKGDLVRQLLVAPLLYEFIPETIFDIEFKELKLDNNFIEHGYIQMGKMGYVTQRSCENILGKMPDEYMSSVLTCLERLQPIVDLKK